MGQAPFPEIPPSPQLLNAKASCLLLSVDTQLTQPGGRFCTASFVAL